MGVTNTMSHIFISYARADRAYADRVKALLENAGYSVWLDTSNLDPNQDFTAEIEYAIKDASHFVVCLTKDVQRKDSFVRREIAFALNTNKKRGQETPVRKLPIIPMVFPEGELTVNISTLTGIIIRTDADIEDGCAELLVRLRRLPDEEFSQSVEVYPEEIAVAYLDSLQDFTSSKLHESVYNLLTLAATSASSISVTNPFSFTFSVSPAIDRGVSINKHETTFSSFHDAFQHQDGRVFMIGQPGAGKTTTLLAFARDSAVARLYNPKLRLPILKSIHTWRPGMEVSQWLFSDIAIYGKEFLEGEKFIFILDGLDELGKKVTAYTKRDSENVEFDISYLEEEQKDQYEEINIDPREFLLDKLSEFTTDHQLVISI